MNITKQSTAVIFKEGPFVDEADFITPLTALTITQSDIQISKNGGAFAQTSDATPTTTHDADGYYPIPLTTADTATLGKIKIKIAMSGALPVWIDLMIVPANTYDSLVLGTDNLDVTTDAPSRTASQADVSALALEATVNALNDFDPALDTVATVTDVTNEVTADAVKISGGATAADNLESTYDGTGYSDIFGPAQQQQIDSISTGSAAINETFDSFVLTTGSEGATDYTETFQRDGVHHEITDTAGVIDAYYEILLTGADTPTLVTFFGRANSANDPITISQWNWNTTSWNTRGTIFGTNTAVDSEHVFKLLGSLIGTGADIGKVRIRISGTGLTSATFRVDELLLGYTKLGESVGYQGGAIWIDTVFGTAGTVPYVNGTADNPVDSLADALTLSGASSVGLKRFEVAQNSTITFVSTMDGFLFNGVDYIINLGGQQVDGTTIRGAVLSGIATGNGGSLLLISCKLGAVTLPEVAIVDGAIADTITISEAGVYVINLSFSAIAGENAPTLDYGAAVGVTSVNIRHYSGGWVIENMKAGDMMTIEGNGQVIFAASCTGGDASIRGNFVVTDNAAGAVTLSDDARFTRSETAEETDAELSDSHGVGAWTTADVSALALEATVDAVAAAIAALNDFDSTTDEVITDAASRTASKADVSLLALEATVAALNNFDPTSDNVTVGDIIAAALAKYATVDTGESGGATGSVVKLSQGAGGSLTVQAIVDGVWDESQADHTDADTFGDYLDAEVSSIGGDGPGNDTCTTTVTLEGSPLPDCNVWITNTAGGEVTIAGAKRTNDFGKVVFLLTAGETYYRWTRKAGTISTLGVAFTAVADV